MSVLAGGRLADGGGASALTTPTLYVSGGSVTLGNAATSIGATINNGGGLLSINGGSVATLSTSGGITTIGPAVTFGAATVGGGLLTLLNTNAYSGPTNVSGGVLRAGQANALSPNSDVIVGTVATGGTLDLTGTAFPQTVNSLTIGSSAALSVNIGTPLASLNNVTFSRQHDRHFRRHQFDSGVADDLRRHSGGHVFQRFR